MSTLPIMLSQPDAKDIEQVQQMALETKATLKCHLVVGHCGESKAAILQRIDALESLKAQHDIELELGFTEDEGELTSQEKQLLQRLFQFKHCAGTPAKLIINTTYRCNNACRFCAVGDRPFKHGDLEAQLHYLEVYAKKGVRLLDLDGGEPTLYPHLFTLIESALELGYERINVTSNGRTLGDARFCRHLLGSGITDLLISIHGGNPKTHDCLTQRKGSFLQTLQGIRNVTQLKPSTLAFGVNMTVTESNYRQIPMLGQILVTMGVAKFNIQMLTPFGSVFDDVVYDLKTVTPFIKKTIEAQGKHIGIQIINMPFCCLEGYEAYIIGDVLKMGRDMHFIDDVPTNLYDYLGGRRFQVDKCKTCLYSLLCGGFYSFDEKYMNIPHQRNES